MNQVRRKRRLTAMETAVLGNVLYLVLVAIFKGIFDVIGRTGEFNYLFNGIELGSIALFWMILFGSNFKWIYAGEKPRAFKYMFFALIPIIILTGTLIVVSILLPGQNSSSIWNQFAFLAAPTIFWYLPFGLIYQLIGQSVSIYVFYAIALILTLIFQMLGINIGRLAGRKYWEETKAEAEAEKIEAERDEESQSENETKRKRSKLPKNKNREMEKSILMQEIFIRDEEILETKEKRRPLVKEVDALILEQEKSESERVFCSDELQEPLLKELEEAEPRNAKPKIQEESHDKSFFMETSQMRIINEEDIDDYYRNKK